MSGMLPRVRIVRQKFWALGKHKLAAELHRTGEVHIVQAVEILLKVQFEPVRFFGSRPRNLLDCGRKPVGQHGDKLLRRHDRGATVERSRSASDPLPLSSPESNTVPTWLSRRSPDSTLTRSILVLYPCIVLNIFVSELAAFSFLQPLMELGVGQHGLIHWVGPLK
jgi:hypothetical protein